jgi:hypothetical protein
MLGEYPCIKYSSEKGFYQDQGNKPKFGIEAFIATICVCAIIYLSYMASLIHKENPVSSKIDTTKHYEDFDIRYGINPTNGKIGFYYGLIPITPEN